MVATPVKAKDIGAGIAERIFSDKEYIDALAEKIKDAVVEKGIVDVALFDFAKEGLEHVESAGQYVREANNTIIKGNKALDAWGQRLTAAEIANRKRDKDILELKGLVRDLSKTVDILLAVIGGANKARSEEGPEQPEEGAGQEESPFLYEEINNLPLSTRARNKLTQAGILTVKDLMEWSYLDIRKVPRLGRKTANEILSFLDEHGIKLKVKRP